MGLFDLFKKKPNPDQFQWMSSSAKHPDGTPMTFDEAKERREKQNELLAAVGAAEREYKIDGDLAKLIQAFEYAFITADPPCHSSQNMKLVDLYLKAGRNSDAWAYLNRLVFTREAPIEKIRLAQARIMKKEKKHIDAIAFYMEAHLERARALERYSADAFLKDIQPSANQLSWDQTKRDYLSHLIEEQISTESYDCHTLREKYKAFLNEISQ